MPVSNQAVTREFSPRRGRAAQGSAISIRGLIKTYDHVAVVDGLDLDVHRGECVALLGPNGSGKTTTVEICEGFRRRDSGVVTVLGVDPWRAGRSWRARVGIVAQSDLGGFDLTVREALNHFAHYHAAPTPTDELIAAVGLQDKARTRVPALSGGQRRRLDVALGVQGRPELLFLDEAAHLADRVAVVAAGRLLEVGEPQALGNRMALGTTVSWTDHDGRPREVVTSEPTSVLRELIARQAGEIDALSVQRPSLEQVYLSMVDAATRSAR